MSKPEITVTCCYTDEGAAATQIIFRSFEFFIQRELTYDSHKFALSRPTHV